MAQKTTRYQIQFQHSWREATYPAIIETPSNRYEGKLPVKLFPHVVIVNGEKLFIIGRHTQEEERRVSDGINEVRLTPPYTSKILTRSKSQIILVGPAYKYDHVTPSHIGVTWSYSIGRGNGAQSLELILWPNRMQQRCTSIASLSLLRPVIVLHRINCLPVTIPASII